MDATILTTLFCFIILVVNLLMFVQQRDLTTQLHHYVDRSDLHTEKLRTILSILQQLEAKQDLMFNNSPPVPGEDSRLIPIATPEHTITPSTIVDWSQCHWVNAPGEPQPDLDNADLCNKSSILKSIEATLIEQLKPNVSVTLPPDAFQKLAAQKLKEHEARKPYAKSNINNGTIEMPAPKKRGPKPGARLGIKRGPYKKKARIDTV